MKHDVLIIDDDQDLHLLYKKRLGDLPIELAFADDGAIGLQMLQTIQYDLILLDLLMPNMTGLELLYHAEQKSIKLPPVIVCSSVSDDEYIITALNAGAANYAIKPLDFQKLRGLVAELLGFEVPASTAQPVSKAIGSTNHTGNAIPPVVPVAATPTVSSQERERRLSQVMADMVFSRKTGKVLVNSSAGNGQLVYEKGRLKTVQFNAVSGMEALEKLRSIQTPEITVQLT